MRKSPLGRALPSIARLFESTPNRVFRRRDMEEILLAQRSRWGLSDSTTLTQFLSFLTSDAELAKVRLEFPSRAEILFVWGQVPPEEVAVAMRDAAYLSHYTAMSLHGLTDQVPKTIYVNVEQPPKRFPSAIVGQGAIDAAFSRKPRVSHNVARFGDHRICMLSGKYTGTLSVVPLRNNPNVRLTGVERTLIDSTVRPFYSGGVGEVLNAFRRARGNISVNALLATLKALDYVYPYHQAIGFYLERAGGYSPTAIELLREIAMPYKFYLTYGMLETEYSERWRLFFPKGL